MGGTQAFDYGAAPAFTTTWNAWGGFYSNIPGTPVGRAAANGDTRILPTGIVMYVGGRSGARSGAIYVGGAACLGVSIPQAGGGQAVGGPTNQRNLVGGGGAPVQAGSIIDGNGDVYQGMNSVTGRAVYARNGDLAVSGRELAGYYDFADAPGAPTLNPVVLNGQVATLTWAAGASGAAGNGNGQTTGRRIQYSTSPTFASDVTTINVGNVLTVDIALPASGVTYYFRVAEKNEVTDLMGSTSQWSTTRSAFVASGGYHRQSAAWRPRIRRYWDATTNAWRPVRRWYRDAGTWKQVK